MSYWQALILGVLQGVTEFLPISSSGHLVVFQDWFGLEPGAQDILLFDVLSHLATLLAAGIVFYKPLKKLFSGTHLINIRAAGFSPRDAQLCNDVKRLGSVHIYRLGFMVITACFVTAAVALPFKDFFKSLVNQPRMVGVGFLLTGVLLFSIRFVPRSRLGWKHWPVWAAAVVGAAQAIAIAPGVSRSGTTISAALLLGLRRRWAAQFSFLIAAPVILGASFLELLDITQTLTTDFITGPLLVGCCIAGVSGYLALRLLLSIVQRAKLHYFAVYVWMLGAYLLFA